MTTPSKEDIEAAFDSEVSGVRRNSEFCTLGQLLVDLPRDRAAVINTKVKDQAHVSAATIARVFKKLGLPPVSDRTIRQHRQGICRCPKGLDL